MSIFYRYYISKISFQFSGNPIKFKSTISLFSSIKELMPNKDEWIIFKIQLEALIEENKDIVEDRKSVV